MQDLPAATVAIVGIGGLGHLALQYGRIPGAFVVGVDIARTSSRWLPSSAPVCVALHAAGRTSVITIGRKLDEVHDSIADVLAGPVPARVVLEL